MLKILPKTRYCASNSTFGNMLDIGIIDPTKVVITALLNASSIAGMLLTTEGAIYEDETERDLTVLGPSPAAGQELAPHLQKTL